jgi:hypothetical protein
MKKFGLLTLNVLFLGLSIAAGLTLVRQSQEVRSQAQTEPSLNLSVDSDNIRVGQHIGVIVEIDSLRTPIGFADLSLSFDPDVLDIINAAPGQFFQHPQIITDKQSDKIGRIHFVTSHTEGQSLSSGTGDLLIIIFLVKKPGPTKVSLPNFHVSLNQTSPNLFNPPNDLILSINP